METKIISQSETEAKIEVTLNEAELAGMKTAVFDHLRGGVKAAGFRPGKAPDAIVERELGPNTVQGEFIDHALQQSYSRVLKEQTFQVVSSPKVSIDKFVPYTELVYTATVELMPKVKLAKYQKFSIKRPSVKVEAEAVDKTIEDLRRREATRLDSEQPAKKGDEVNFDFEGSKDGEPVPGATAKNQTLQLGSGNFIPGFEDELTGLKKGEEKTFDIRFPKGYQEASLSDQMVTFKVKLNTVTDLVLPEVDDAFVDRVGPFKNVGELKADIIAKITGERAEAATRDFEKIVLDKLLAESHYQAPKALVDQQLESMRAELEQNLASSGLDIAKYLELSNKTAESLDTDMRPEAERRVGMAMVLTAVAAEENISVTAAELDDEIGRLKQDYTDPQTQAELDNPSTREEVYNHLMASRVISKLLAYAEKI